MNYLKDSLFNLDVCVTILSGLVALFGLLPRPNRIKISVFKLNSVWRIPIISIILIFLAKILPFLPFKIPFQFLEFLAYPVIYDVAAFFLLLCYCWWCKNHLLGEVVYEHAKKGKCYDFLLACMNEGVDYEKIKACLFGALDDILNDANHVKKNSLPNSNEYKAVLILKKCFSEYDDTIGEDVLFITIFVTKVQKIYEQYYKIQFPFISTIVEKAFTRPESKLYQYTKRAKNLNNNQILSFLVSSSALRAKQDLTTILHGKEKVFQKNNSDVYLNFVQFIATHYFENIPFRFDCDFNNCLYFYFDQYNSIMHNYLANGGVEIFNFYTTFFKKATSTLNEISDVTYQIFETSYFEYIDILNQVYLHENDLIFMQYSMDLWKEAKEEWMLPISQKLFKSLRHNIENFSIHNCHLLRYFFICESWDNRPYEFIGQIWDIIKEKFGGWYSKNQNLVQQCLPIWITYNSESKKLEKHPLINDRSKVISSFQCI